MGFALWVDGETAWCAGTHEYRPMGVAVVAASSLFQARDFDHLRRPPSQRSGQAFHGLFASLVDVNSYMMRQGRSQPRKRNFRRQQAVLFK